MLIENDGGYGALYPVDLEHFVLENFSEGQYAIYFQHTDNIIFACNFIDIRNLGEFYKALGYFLQLFRVYEKVEKDSNIFCRFKFTEISHGSERTCIKSVEGSWLV